jgi:hypothetical protein
LHLLGRSRFLASLTGSTACVGRAAINGGIAAILRLI